VVVYLTYCRATRRCKMGLLNVSVGDEGRSRLEVT